MGSTMQGSAVVAVARSRSHGFATAAVLLFAGATLVTVQIAAAQDAAPAVVAKATGVHNGGVPALERRLQVLTRELGLEPGQQVRIRRILESQRDAIHRIWSDPAVPPAERAAATQAQTERTGDDIRAALNEDQKKIYNRSRRDSTLPPNEKRDVEQWMSPAPAGKPDATQ
jgi:hypothetical protein